MKYSIQYSSADLESHFDYNLKDSSKSTVLVKLTAIVNDLFANVPSSARCVHFTAHGSFSLSWEQPESPEEKQERLLNESRNKQYELSEMYKLMKKYPLEAKAGF